MCPEYATDTDNDTDTHLVEHDYMLSNTVQFGMVVKQAEDDPEKPKDIATVLVHIGGTEKGTYTRNWMPWITQRAGYDAEWWMPDLNEQVVVLAPSGNLKLGIVLGTLFHGTWMSFTDKDEDFTKVPKLEQKIYEQEEAAKHKRYYQDGTSLVYDKLEHKLSYDVKENNEDEEAGIAASIMLKDKAASMALYLGSKEGEQTKIDVTDKDMAILSQEEIGLSLEKSKLQLTKDEGIKLEVGNASITLHEKNGIKLEVGGVSAVLSESDGIKLVANGTTLTVSDSGVDAS